MQNQQLVDYIKQQLQGGIQKDAIKKALLDAGWPAGDVEDSMKVSDSSGTFSASGMSATITPSAAMAGGKSADTVISKTPNNAFFADHSVSAEKPRGDKVAMIVMGVAIVLLLGALGYFYYTLKGEASKASGENTASVSEAQNLKVQLQKSNDDKTTLANQNNSLLADNRTLLAELSFLFAAPGETSGEITTTIGGTITSGTSGYVLTTSHGVKVAIKNSKDARVDSALKPLIGNKAELTGTHRAGVAELAVTIVNGNVLGNAATPVATSTVQ